MGCSATPYVICCFVCSLFSYVKYSEYPYTFVICMKKSVMYSCTIIRIY